MVLDSFKCTRTFADLERTNLLMESERLYFK
jgi:hypothetical protein